MTADLPEPRCLYGFIEAQVRQLVSDEPLERFRTYMDIKAHAICQGIAGCSEPHGDVFYPHEVLAFIERQH